MCLILNIYKVGSTLIWMICQIHFFVLSNTSYVKLILKRNQPKIGSSHPDWHFYRKTSKICLISSMVICSFKSRIFNNAVLLFTTEHTQNKFLITNYFLLDLPFICNILSITVTTKSTGNKTTL